jgi:transitional endoplasmic reticulum ATPase
MHDFFHEVRRDRRRLAEIARPTPQQLHVPLRAYAWNLLTSRFGPADVDEIPLTLLANPLVREAFEVPPEVAVPLDEDGDPDLGPGGAAGQARRVRALRSHLAERWRRDGVRCLRPPFAAAPIGGGIRLLARTLGLTRLDAAILQLAVAVSLSRQLARLVGAFPTTRREQVAAVAASALGASPAEVRRRVAAGAPLFQSGLLRLHPDIEAYDTWSVTPHPKLPSLVQERGLGPDALLSRFLAREPAPALGLADFAHLRADLDVARRLLAAGLDARRPGLNVLLHGPSGTGKTQVARALAAAVGVPLFAAGAADEDGDPITGQDRLGELRIGHRLLARSRALLVFDEWEDLAPRRMPWSDGELRGVPKLWFNRLLEENPVPTLWITNGLDEIDPAYLRRFAQVIRFPALGEAQRRTVWERVAPDLDDAGRRERAAAYDVSPGEIASAIAGARLVGGGAPDAAALDRILSAAVRAVPGRRVATARRAGEEYRLEAVNASTDLARLTESLCAWTPGAGAGVSLCLYGRSGTGKSEWVHHLARRMARPLVVRRVSDLESKWVGETEQNLARAFDEAEQQDAVLLLDECDWLLADRRGAQHAWELSRVAEALQQLEAYRGVVACTTNLFRELDQAVLRRFVHKIEFRALRPEQAVLMWESHLARFCGPAGDAARAAIADALRRMRGLTPGDFGVVARRAAQVVGAWGPEALVRELEAESLARGHEGRTVGF